MVYLFWLSKENIALAQAELKFLSLGSVQIIDNLLVADVKETLFSRLALTKAVFQFLFSCPSQEVMTNIGSYDFRSVYEKDFKVVVHHAPKQLKAVADAVYARLTKPKVNLKMPTTEFHFFFLKDTVVAGKLLVKPERDFEKRKGQHRPAPHPSTMHPKLARVMINLTGVIDQELVDPLCGSGGILIEAATMKIPCKGYDIDAIMIKRAKKNLAHFGLDVSVVQADATTIDEQWQYVATDVPYGKSTKKQDMVTLYTNFLKNLNKNLVNRAVVMFPHWADVDDLVNEAGLKIVDKFSWYVHRHLSRTLVVLTK